MVISRPFGSSLAGGVRQAIEQLGHRGILMPVCFASHRLERQARLEEIDVAGDHCPPQRGRETGRVAHFGHDRGAGFEQFGSTGGLTVAPRMSHPPLIGAEWVVGRDVGGLLALDLVDLAEDLIGWWR